MATEKETVYFAAESRGKGIAEEMYGDSQAIVLNSINDMVFHGICIKCGNKVARYIESGENIEYVNRIDKLRIKKNAYTNSDIDVN